MLIPHTVGGAHTRAPLPLSSVPTTSVLGSIRSLWTAVQSVLLVDQSGFSVPHYQILCKSVAKRVDSPYRSSAFGRFWG